MKNSLLFIFFCILNISLFSQAKEKSLVHLKQELKVTENDSSKIRLITEIIKLKTKGRNYEELDSLTNQLLSISKQSNNIKGLIKGYQYKGKFQCERGNNDSGMLNFSKGIKLAKENELYNDLAYLHIEQTSFLNNLDSSIYLTRKSLNIFHQLKDTNTCIRSLMKMGYYFNINGNIDSAQWYYHLGLKYAEQSQNKKLAASCHSYIGNVHSSRQNYDQAKIHFNKAIKIGKNIKEEYIVAEAQHFLGGLYYYQQNTDTALVYLLESLNYFDKIKYMPMQGTLNSSISGIYSFQENYEKALSHLDKSKNIFEKLNDNKSLVSIYIYLGEVHTQLKHYRTGEQHYLKALDLIHELSIFEYEDMVYEGLTILYRNEGNYKKAYESYESLTKIRDSLFGESKLKSINELQTKYETSKKDAEIKELALSNELASSKEKEQRTKAQVYLWGGLALISFIGLGGLLYYRNRKSLFEKKQYKLEQKLLQTQLNPHFMSNFLMAIQTSAHKDSPDQVSNNIGKFGRLNRQVLDASRSDYIVLTDEIDFIKNYLDLQLILFPNRFTYNIATDSNIDPDEIEMPPMLIQPFLENAVEHAFSNNDTTGELNINFSMKNSNLIIDINDNGKGINSKKVITNDIKSKSHATDITNERIELFKQKWNKNIKFAINELPIGTQVTFHIPVSL